MHRTFLVSTCTTSCFAVKEIEDKLKQDSILELKTQLLAHKAAMEKLQAEMEHANQEEIEALKRQCESDMGKRFLDICTI